MTDDNLPAMPPVDERMTPREAAEYSGIPETMLRDMRSTNYTKSAPLFYNLPHRGQDGSRSRVFYWKRHLDLYVQSCLQRR